MKICIVGAGVAGIQVADVLTENGHDCHIFEREASVGGVWRRNYVGYALQVPMELYEFPGMPIPEKDGTFPDGDSVMKYIESYVEKRDLFARCTFHFEEAVLRVEQVDERWSVTTKMGQDMFDFCVVCTGMYNVPHVPVRSDKTIHSSEFTDDAVVANKNVVVLGAGKSAIDCAVASSKCASRVTLLSRKMHWPVPRYIAGLVPFKWGTYSRIGHFLLPPHWNLSRTEAIVHKLSGWFKWSIWRVLEQIFSWQFSLKTRPDTPIEVDLFNGGQILTTEFRDAVSANKIEIEKYTSNHPALQSADVIISATGFKKEYGIFDTDTLSRLDVQDDGLWLYKNIIPPLVENLAFVGSEVSTFNNILTQHIQARWLAYTIKNGGIASVEEMTSEVEKEKAWKRSWMPFTTSRAALLQLHMTKYHDTLMEDMDRPVVCRHVWKWAIPHTAREYRF